MTAQSLMILFASFAPLIFAVGKMYLADKSEIHIRLNEHSKLIVALEEKAHHAPTHEDMGKLHEKMNELNRMQGRMSGVLEGILTTNQMIVEKAMMGGGKT